MIATEERTDREVLTGLLGPVGWRVLVRMPELKKQTEGGLYMPEKSAEREALATMCGEVMAVGADCYPAAKFPNGPWCREGDWVLFRSYSGTFFTFRGREYRLLNDDAIEAVTSCPEEVRK